MPTKHTVDLNFALEFHTKDSNVFTQWVLGEGLALVIEKLMYKSANLRHAGKEYPDNLHLMRYLIDKLLKGRRMDGALFNLDQSIAFDRANHCFLEADMRAVVGFGPVFRCRIAA